MKYPLLFLLLLPQFSFSQFVNYNTSNGLAGNIVKRIAIDAQGSKWFATENGVSKFNGSTWTTYRTQNGLVSNIVNAVAIDQLGRKWFGTPYGASMFDGNTWTTYTMADGLVNNYIYDIAVDNQGNIWFGTSLGVSRFDGTTWTSFKEGFSVFVVEKDVLGNIWLGPGGSGICKFDGVNWYDYTTDSGLVSYSTYAVGFDLQGTKWIGTNRGVAIFDDVTWDTIQKSDGLPNKNVYAVTVDALNCKWFGTWEGGLAKLNGTVWTYFTVLNGLASDKIWDIVIDSQGDLWIGTGGGGVSKFDGSPPPKNGPDWRWARGVGGNYNNWGYASNVASNGDLVMAGGFGSDSVKFGYTTLYNNGPAIRSDVYITRTDPGGNFLWAKGAGGTDYDDAYAVTTDQDGNVYATGRFRSEMIHFDSVQMNNTGSAGTDDIFLCKYNGDGVFQWAKILGGPSSDAGTCIAIATDGTVYIAGSLDGSIFIAAYSPSGNLLWLNPSVGDGINSASKMVTGPGGVIYLTGYFGGTSITFGNLTLNNSGSSRTDGFLYSFDATGNPRWAKQVQGADWDEGTGLAVDPDGNLLFCGLFNSNQIIIDGAVLNNTGSIYFDFFLARFDSSGNLLWAEKGGSDSDDEARSVTCDTLGNAYLTGTYRSQTIKFGTTTLPNAGYHDTYLTKYDISGKVMWAKRVGGNGEDYVKSVMADSEGSIYLSGDFSSNTMKFDSIALSNNVYLDLFIARLQSYISSNSPVCEGTRLQLTTDSIPGATYRWQGPGGFTSTQRCPVISNNTTLAMAGVYYLSLTIGGSTKKAGHTTVAVVASPSQVVAAVNGLTCAGSAISLSTTTVDNASYAWIGPLNFHSQQQNPLVSNHALPSMSGVYTVSCSVANCPLKKASVNVTIHDLPAIPVITSDSGTLVTTVSNHYQWFLNGIAITGDTLQEFTPKENGDYTVMVTDHNGCSALSAIHSLVNYGIDDPRPVNGITVYPNPTSGELFIQVPAKEWKLSLADMQGRVVHESALIVDKEIRISIAAEGIYSLILDGPWGRTVRKIMIVKP